MSRIFLSHHNSNNREALALKLWLESEGWRDEIFLDFDPEAGIKTGTRWKEVLAQAGSRCEAVVCLTSPGWVASPECQAEYRTAENLAKKIFVVQLGELGTPDKTREWQGTRLFGDGPVTEIVVGLQQPSVRFLTDGLTRLRLGLLEAGISRVLSKHFPWPPVEEPKREPYRGLKPFKFIDAGVYYGRDAEILRGLAELDRMRRAGNAPLFVILGASGAGKSSFLRAGLLPRLKWDDRNFFPLEVVRPERSPLYGDHGLARAISLANRELKLNPVNPGEVKVELENGADCLRELFYQIQEAARVRLVGLQDNSLAPTLVLAVDQAEELFTADATKEASEFLNLMGSVVRGGSNGTSVPRVSIIVAFTIRSDRYESLQTTPTLAGLRSVLFDDLRPMHPAQFKEVIIGPAYRQLVNGRPLNVSEELVRQLLKDSEKGADPLPLLSLTLEKLYQDYSNDGDLRLDEYETMGGMGNVIRTIAESILDQDQTKRELQLKSLHDAFIPWLATINKQNDQPMRRIALMSKIPPESRPLIRKLIENRLLASYQDGGEERVEVAHESLFRQWLVLRDWLEEERDDLKEADRLEEDEKAWSINKEKDAWLRGGERLTKGEILALKPAYQKRLEPIKKFLEKSRQKEDENKQKDEDRRKAEIRTAQKEKEDAEKLAAVLKKAAEQAGADATRLRKRGRQLKGWMVFAFALACCAVGITIWAINTFRVSKALILNAEASAILSGVRPGTMTVGLGKLLAAYRLAPLPEIEGTMLAQVLALQRLEKTILAGPPVTSVAISRDGTQLLSVGKDGIVRVWNARDGKAIRELPNRKNGLVMRGVLTPDGPKVVYKSDDGKTLQLWNVQTDKPIGKPLMGHNGLVTSMAFSQDGMRLLSGGEDGTLQLWDAQMGQAIGEPLKGHTGSVTSVAFSRSREKFISGERNGTVRLWDAHTREPIGKVLKVYVQDPGEDDFESISLESVAFNWDGTRFLSVGLRQGLDILTMTSWDRWSMELWNTGTGASIKDPKMCLEIMGINAVFMKENGSQIILNCNNGIPELWNTQMNQPIVRLLDGYDGSGTRVAFSSDRTRLLSSDEDGTLRLWNMQQERPIGSDPNNSHYGGVTSVAFSPDGTQLLSGGRDGTVRLWDADTRAPNGDPLKGHKDVLGFNNGPSYVNSVTFSPDGTRLLSGGVDGTVRLWDADTRAPIGDPLKGHIGSVESVAYSRDGTRFLSGGTRGTVQLWDAKSSGRIGDPLEGHDGPVTSVAFSPDGRWLLSGGIDGTVRLWNADTRAPIGDPLEGHIRGRATTVTLGSGTSVAFSPDGRWLLSGGTDGTVRLWNAQTRQPIGAPLRGHNGPVTSVAFSPDGRWLLSGGTDGTVRLWNAQTRQPIGAPLRGHNGPVTSVAYSRDEKQLLSGGRDGTVRLWPAPKIWPDLLCAKVGRNMSHKEWREYVSTDIDYIPQCPGLPIPSDESEEQMTSHGADNAKH